MMQGHEVGDNSRHESGDSAHVHRRNQQHDPRDKYCDCTDCTTG